MRSAAAALSRLTDPEAKVSAHYVVTEPGEVLELVAPTHRAWHAGLSCWEGRGNINDNSIGIELVNPGHEWGYRSFPEAQMEALVDLLEGLIKTHDIPSWRVLAHSDVAPRRKEDPGELFDWAMLAENGIGLWPTSIATEAEYGPETSASQLSEIGYCLAEDFASPAEVLRAFQRHFRPGRVDGLLDAETSDRIEAVRRLCGAIRGPS